MRWLAKARMATHHRRSEAADHRLAIVLAAIAGAANAGGFFALGQYTSHMTGYLSLLADHLVLGNIAIAGSALLAIFAFAAGAAFSTFLVNWARLKRPRKQFSLPLAVQAVFLGCFSFGGIFASAVGHLLSLAFLCFIMGMQNATITKISGARIRTTHATGMITDIGIESGRVAFGFFNPSSKVRADHPKLKILCSLVFAFLAGGIVGAAGYGIVGFFFSLPLAAVLLALSLPNLLSRR